MHGRLTLFHFKLDMTDEPSSVEGAHSTFLPITLTDRPNASITALLFSLTLVRGPRLYLDVD